MYNPKYAQRMENFSKDLWGIGCLDERDAAKKASKRYFPTANVQIVECYQNSNGEFIPCSAKRTQEDLEAKISSE